MDAKNIVNKIKPLCAWRKGTDCFWEEKKEVHQLFESFLRENSGIVLLVQNFVEEENVHQKFHHNLVANELWQFKVLWVVVGSA